MPTKTLCLAITGSLLALTACNSNSSSDRLAERVENAADARADSLEAQADNFQARADMLDNRAEQVRDIGDARADAIEAADRNVAVMSQEQRDAIVANQAAAVR